MTKNVVLVQTDKNVVVVHPPTSPPVVIIAVPNVGPQGPQGRVGAQGPQGDAGAQGDVGPQGAIGTGTQGPQGDTGVSGPQGAQGSVGSTGAQGFQGSQGSPGTQGVGSQGAQGAQGAQGVSGAQGVGTQGPQGNAGTPGPQGPQGVGSQGPQGAQGGAGGPQGPQGPQGTPGGPQGPQGTPGKFTVASVAPAGASPGDVWWDSDNGSTYILYDDGTSMQWVSFVGAPGPQGAQGVAGAGGGSVGGTNMQVQFNDNGVFGGDADLTYNKSARELTSYRLVVPYVFQCGYFSMGANGSWNYYGGGLNMRGNHVLGWCPGADDGTLRDVGIARNAVGVLEINNATAGQYRDLKLRALSTAGQSLTGAQADSLLDLATTWNTTGAPAAIKLNVTNTASVSGSLLDLRINGTTKFHVDMNDQAHCGYFFAAGFIEKTYGYSLRAGSGLKLRNSASQSGIRFTSGAYEYDATDSCIVRSAAGVLAITDGSDGPGAAGQYRDLIVRNLNYGAEGTGTLRHDKATGITSFSDTFQNFARVFAYDFEDPNANVALGTSTFGTGLTFALAARIAWSTVHVRAGAIDTGITRNAPGVVEINNGTAGQYRDLKLRNITGSAASYNCAINLQNSSVEFARAASTGNPIASAGNYGAGYQEGFYVNATGGLYFATNVIPGPFDVGFARNAAGVIEVNSGRTVISGTGTYADLKLRRTLIAPTALGTVVDGAFEYDGAAAWFTVGSTRHQIAPAASSSEQGWAVSPLTDRWLPVWPMPQGTASQAIGLGTIYAVRVRLGRAIKSINYFTVGGTASTLRLVVYDDSAYPYPGALLFASSDVATSPFGSRNTAVDLPAGIYWFGLHNVHLTATPTVRATTMMNLLSPGFSTLTDVAANMNCSCIYTSGHGSVSPTTWPAGSGTEAPAPVFQVQGA